jgi:hypothetical protein
MWCIGFGCLDTAGQGRMWALSLLMMYITGEGGPGGTMGHMLGRAGEGVCIIVAYAHRCSRLLSM